MRNVFTRLACWLFHSPWWHTDHVESGDEPISVLYCRGCKKCGAVWVNESHLA